MKTVTRTKDGTEHKHIFYTKGVRHQVTYVYDKMDELQFTHVVMEEKIT